MEALQMLKFSFKHGEPLNFTTGMDRSEEIQFLESAETAAALVPEDLEGFLKWLNTS